MLITCHLSDYYMILDLHLHNFRDLGRQSQKPVTYWIFLAALLKIE